MIEIEDEQNGKIKKVVLSKDDIFENYKFKHIAEVLHFITLGHGRIAFRILKFFELFVKIVIVNGLKKNEWNSKKLFLGLRKVSKI